MTAFLFVYSAVATGVAIALLFIAFVERRAGRFHKGEADKWHRSHADLVHRNASQYGELNVVHARIAELEAANADLKQHFDIQVQAYKDARLQGDELLADLAAERTARAVAEKVAIDNMVSYWRLTDMHEKARDEIGSLKDLLAREARTRENAAACAEAEIRVRCAMEAKLAAARQEIADLRANLEEANAKLGCIFAHVAAVAAVFEDVLEEETEDQEASPELFCCS